MVLLSCGGRANAQGDLESRPTLPTGFLQESSLSSSAAESESALDQLDLVLGLTTLYDSNVTQGSDGGLVAAESDWLTTPSLGASYELGNRDWQVGARGNLVYQYYHQRDDFRSANYSTSFFANYQTRKFQASLTTGLGRTGGINRFTSGFVEQLNYTTQFRARARVSRKTSFEAFWTSTSIESKTAGFGDTTSLTTGLSGLRKASSRITLGPGFRYGVRTGVDDQELTLIGPTLQLNYQFSTKISLQSTVGVDRVDSPDVDPETLTNWSLGLDYRASSFWGFNLDLIRDTQPVFSAGGGVDQVSSYRFSYWRQIRDLRATLGVIYDNREPTDSRAVTSGFRDGEFVTFSSNFALPVYQKQATLNLSFNWREQSTADVKRSWDGFQMGLGLQWAF